MQENLDIHIPFCYKVKRLLPPIVLSMQVLGVYAGYLTTFILPLIFRAYPDHNFLHRGDQWNLGIAYLSVSGFFLFWVIFSLIRAGLTTPGAVTQEWSDQMLQKALKHYDVYYHFRKQDGLHAQMQRDFSWLKHQILKDKNIKNFYHKAGFRICKECNMFKPIRTHHCRQCGVCILKMDHHCNWLVNCMGFKNYKYFLVGLMHAVFLSIFCITTYSECFFDAISHRQRSLAIILGISFTWVMQLSVVCIIGSFTVFHLTQLAGKGKTTIEFCEGKRSGQYNLGFVTNLYRILGKNPLFWCQPFGVSKEGTGVDFEENPDHVEGDDEEWSEEPYTTPQASVRVEDRENAKPQNQPWGD